jgi:hypothetical protein
MAGIDYFSTIRGNTKEQKRIFQKSGIFPISSPSLQRDEAALFRNPFNHEKLPDATDTRQPSGGFDGR